MGDFIQHNIERLNSDHQRDDFDCGKRWLNDYIRMHASKNEAHGYGRTYVAVRPSSSVVEGFFTLSMSSVMFENLTDDLAQNMPKYPMPVAHLGCLAVRKEHHGKGLGGILLIDSFRRILAASELIAARALEVKAADDEVRTWYTRRGFLRFKDHANHLYLPLDTIREVVAETENLA
jgi:GNAT superfamily N-acetyltransferase